MERGRHTLGQQWEQATGVANWSSSGTTEGAQIAKTLAPQGVSVGAYTKQFSDGSNCEIELHPGGRGSGRRETPRSYKRSCGTSLSATTHIRISASGNRVASAALRLHREMQIYSLWCCSCHRHLLWLCRPLAKLAC